MYNQQHSLHRDSPPQGEQYVGDLDYGDDKTSSLFTFWRIIRVLRKWWWVIGLLTLAALALSILHLSRVTPTYSAEVTLEVRQQERNIIGTASVDDINANREFLVTQIELLKSETLAKSVVETLNLTSDPDFFNAEAPNAAAVNREEKVRNAVLRFKKSLKVYPVGNSRLITLRFEHSNPNMAATIANTTIESFIDDSLKRKYNASIYARDFLQNRLITVKASLEKAERDLVRYASDNGIISLESDDAGNSSNSLDKTALITLDNELTQTRTNRMRAEQAYSNSKAANFSLEILQNDSLNALKNQHTELQSQYIDQQTIYKPNFPAMLELKKRIELFEKNIAQETAEIIRANRAELENEYLIANAQEADLARRVALLKNDVVGLRERSIEYTILKREVDTERTQYEALLQRLKEVSISEDIGANLVEIVDKAQPARSPFKPNKGSTILTVLLLTSGLTFALAYGFEIIDDRIKQPEDIKTKLGQIIMGVIPKVQNPKELINLLTDPQAMISEAYAALRTNLQYSGVDGGPRIIQLTSTKPGEGKSVSSLALALRYVGLGKKTLLIDADMRRPTFKVSSTEPIGLSHLLTSNDDLASHVTKTLYDGLDVITSGLSIPNPSEALSSERFSKILELAREQYTYVIVDSPPVIGLADAPVIGAKVDATVIIVEYNTLRASSIKAAIDRLSMSGTKILGVVLSKYTAPAHGYSYYRYNYGKNATAYGENNKNTVKSKQKFTLD